jgi:hypothetical protein
MELDTSRIAPASSVKFSIQVFKQRERERETDQLECSVVLNGFENALNWELVKIGITVASQRLFYRRKLGACF